MLRIVSVPVLLVVFVPLLADAADYQLSEKNTTITFVGTKPNGKHDGGFTSVKGTASVANNDPTSLKVSLTIDTNSLYADNPKLTMHLKSPDFFNVKSSPTSKFVSSKVEKAGDEYQITGDLTLLDKTKSITVPAKLAVSGNGLTLTSSFTIDRTEWGMNYGKGKVDEKVKLNVNIKAKS